jgi:acyl carrier protein
MDKKDIEAKIIAWLNEFIKNWDLDEEITGFTRLNQDLCFSSVNMIQFMSKIDLEFQKKFPFELMVMNNGEFKKELLVTDVVNFVFENQ